VIVLNTMSVGEMGRKTATILVQTEAAHRCDSCGKAIKVGQPAYFSWDVYGAYFTHRDVCKVRNLHDRKPTVAVPARVEGPLTILPIADKRKRGAPKNVWQAERLGWDGKPLA
jgi:hypothetical protein